MEESVEESSMELSKEELIWKPRYGMEFDYDEVAYDFYNEYGRREGFSIRKDSCAKDKFGVITSRTFVCCKEGKYCVYRFSEEHNHPLVKIDLVHMLPSHRNAKASDGAFIDLTSNSRVPPKSAFELMGKHAGGILRFSKQDQKNYLRTV
ncbi:PREDICTED: protein FAR1-RELATED SEQUENCE 5-like [Fragaria vesca subsp. vesca]